MLQDDSQCWDAATQLPSDGLRIMELRKQWCDQGLHKIFLFLF